MKDIEKLQAKALAVAGLLDIPAHRLFAIDPDLKRRVISVAGRIWREREVSDLDIARAAGIFRMGDFDSDSEDFLRVALWRKEVLGNAAPAFPAHGDHEDLRRHMKA
ncbi:MAG: hypothetical protein EBT18_10740 [Gammaproteobacteria bacterium]|nr:hypothetical protein [Gammaproteobacteria bacterium]